MRSLSKLKNNTLKKKWGAKSKRSANLLVQTNITTVELAHRTILANVKLLFQSSHISRKFWYSTKKLNSKSNNNLFWSISAEPTKRKISMGFHWSVFLLVRISMKREMFIKKQSQPKKIKQFEIRNTIFFWEREHSISTKRNA